MKRDLVIAKKILSWIEVNTPPHGSRRDEIRSGISYKDSDSVPFDETLKLLAGSGFLVCEHSGTGHDYYNLTWVGHDLLEKLRADKSPKMLDL